MREVNKSFDLPFSVNPKQFYCTYIFVFLFLFFFLSEVERSFRIKPGMIEFARVGYRRCVMTSELCVSQVCPVIGQEPDRKRKQIYLLGENSGS